VVVILSIVALCMWFLLPLLPSILIYRLFPKSPVRATGVLAGITFNAGGAFAAYLILFAVAAPFIVDLNDRIDRSRSQFWTINATVQLDGANIEDYGGDTFAVLRPDVVDFTEGNLEIAVRKDERGMFPRITIVVGCNGDRACIAAPREGAYYKTINLNSADLKMKELPGGRLQLVDTVRLVKRVPRTAPPPPSN